MRRLPFAALVAVLAFGAACITNNREQAREPRTPPPSATPATPAPTPSRTPVTGPRILLEAKALSAGAEALGPDWKLDREGSAVSLQWGRTFVPQRLPALGPETMALNVSVDESADGARFAYATQFGSLASATTAITRALGNRPINPNSITVAEVGGVPKLGADDEHLFCVNFTDPTGGVRYVEYWAAFRVLNVVARMTSFRTGAADCASAAEAPADLLRLRDAAYAKIRSAPVTTGEPTATATAARPR